MKTRKNMLSNYFKVYTLIMLMMGFVTLIFACKDDDDKKPRTGSANVMAVHAAPDATAASFFLDDTKISNAALTYGQNTAYVNTPSGKRKATFKSGAENNNQLATKEVNLGDKKKYTVFFAGTVAAPDVLLFEDDLAEPRGNKAKVRFVNLSPDNTKLDIRLKGGDKISTGREYKSASDFVEVESGAVTYEVLDNADNNKMVFTMPNFTLAGGKIYTIWIKGSANGVGDAALGANLIVHN